MIKEQVLNILESIINDHATPAQVRVNAARLWAELSGYIVYTLKPD